MRRLRRPCTSPRVFPAGLLLAAFTALAGPAAAQWMAPDYALNAPTWLLPPANLADPDLSPRLPLASWGTVRLAASGSSSGNGLSLEAGEKWFARAGLGRSLETGVVSLGGGYRFPAGDALSMQFTRQLGQERLGLAVRYDWQRSYLRLSYEQPLRPAPGSADLRFSAGVRF